MQKKVFFEKDTLVLITLWKSFGHFDTQDVFHSIWIDSPYLTLDFE